MLWPRKEILLSTKSHIADELKCLGVLGLFIYLFIKEYFQCNPKILKLKSTIG